MCRKVGIAKKSCGELAILASIKSCPAMHFSPEAALTNLSVDDLTKASSLQQFSGHYFLQCCLICLSDTLTTKLSGATLPPTSSSDP
jgi:hypothetical protein